MITILLYKLKLYSHITGAVVVVIRAHISDTPWNKGVKLDGNFMETLPGDSVTNAF